MQKEALQPIDEKDNKIIGDSKITRQKVLTWASTLGLAALLTACGQAEQNIVNATQEALNPTNPPAEVADTEPSIAPTAEPPANPTAPPTTEQAELEPTPELSTINTPELIQGNILSIGGSELIENTNSESISIDTNLIVENPENNWLFEEFKVQFPTTEGESVEIKRLLDSQGNIVGMFSTTVSEGFDYNPINNILNLSPSRTLSDGINTTVIHLNGLFSKDELVVNQGADQGETLGVPMFINVWNSESGVFNVRTILVDPTTGEVLNVPEETSWDSHVYELSVLDDNVEMPRIFLNPSGLLEAHVQAQTQDGQTVLTLDPESSYFVLGEPEEELNSIERSQYPAGSFIIDGDSYKNRIITTLDREEQLKLMNDLFNNIYYSQNNKALLNSYGITNLEQLGNRDWTLPAGIEIPTGNTQTPHIDFIKLEREVDLSSILVEFVYPELASGTQASSVIIPQINAELNPYKNGGVVPFRWSFDSSNLICWIPLLEENGVYMLKLFVYDRRDGLADQGNLLPSLENLNNNNLNSLNRLNKTMDLAIRMWEYVGVDRFDQFEGSEYFNKIVETWYESDSTSTHLIVDHPALQ